MLNPQTSSCVYSTLAVSHTLRLVLSSLVSHCSVWSVIISFHSRVTTKGVFSLRAFTRLRVYARSENAPLQADLAEIFRKG